MGKIAFWRDNRPVKKTSKLLGLLLIALGLFAVSCGSSPTATPRLPPSTATLSVGPTATAEPRPSPTSIALPSPTGVVPTVVPTSVANALSAGACANRYAFISDVSIPDGTTLTAGQGFTKTWRVRNLGTCIWGDGYTLAFVRGQAMTELSSIAVPRTEPGDTVDLSVLMTAPTTPGSYEGFWELRNPRGLALTPDLWIKIVVP